MSDVATKLKFNKIIAYNCLLYIISLYLTEVLAISNKIVL